MTRRIALVVAMACALAAIAASSRQAAPGASSLSITFVYDVTPSMTVSVSTDVQLKKAMHAIARAVEPGDRLRFGALAGQLLLSEPLDVTEVAKLPKLVPDLRGVRVAPSPLWDELEVAVDVVAADPGRHALIAVTDCRSTANVHSLADLVAHAKGKAVAISTIVEDSLMRRPGTPLPIVPADTCAALSKATGGLFEFDDDRNPLGDIGELVTYAVRTLREGNRASQLPTAHR